MAMTDYSFLGVLVVAVAIALLVAWQFGPKSEWVPEMGRINQHIGGSDPRKVGARDMRGVRDMESPSRIGGDFQPDTHDFVEDMDIPTTQPRHRHNDQHSGDPMFTPISRLRSGGGI